MARTIEPDCRQCRREGVKLYLKGMLESDSELIGQPRLEGFADFFLE